MAAAAPPAMGTLVKLGRTFKNWLPRCFWLDGDTLRYFASEEDALFYSRDPVKHAKKQKGSVAIPNATLFIAFYAEQANCFEIGTPTRFLYVSAPKRAEMYAWIERFTAAGACFVSPLLNAVELSSVAAAGPMPVFGLQGYMRKQGYVNKRFKARFFRTVEDVAGEMTLVYYRRYDDVKPRGKIRLVGARVERTVGMKRAVLDDDDSTARFQFSIDTPTRTFVLRPCSERELEMWLSTLRYFCEHVTAGTPTIEQLKIEKAQRLKQQQQPAESSGGRLSIEDMRTYTTSATAANDEKEEQHRAATQIQAVFRGQQVRKKKQQHAPPKGNRMLRMGKLRTLVETGGFLIKYGRRGQPHKKYIFVREGRIFWVDKQDDRYAPSKKLPLAKSMLLASVNRIVKGKRTAVFQRDVATRVAAAQCFSVLMDERTLDLEAPSQEARNDWCEAIALYCSKSKAATNSDDNDNNNNNSSEVK